MKKIYLSLMLLGAVAFTSCDMNTTPWGVLDEGTAIQTPKDLRKFRNQLYANLRGVTSGSWIYSTDIQMDEFIGLISNGNQLGEFSKGTFTALMALSRVSGVRAMPLLPTATLFWRKPTSSLLRKA